MTTVLVCLIALLGLTVLVLIRMKISDQKLIDDAERKVAYAKQAQDAAMEAIARVEAQRKVETNTRDNMSVVAEKLREEILAIRAIPGVAELIAKANTMFP